MVRCAFWLKIKRKLERAKTAVGGYVMDAVRAAKPASSSALKTEDFKLFRMEFTKKERVAPLSHREELNLFPLRQRPNLVF
jgi:hypothetical protein